MFIPTLQISKADRKRLGELAEPYFGQVDCASLADEAARMLRRLAPWSDIRVAHFPSPAGLLDSQIRLGIFVDCNLAQALFLTKGDAGDA